MTLERGDPEGNARHVTVKKTELACAAAETGQFTMKAIVQQLSLSLRDDRGHVSCNRQQKVRRER